MFRDGRADVGYLRRSFEDTGLRKVPVGREQKVAGIPVTHPRARRQAIASADLDGESILDAQTRRTSSLKKRFELIASGQGIALVHQRVARSYSRPDLVYLPSPMPSLWRRPSPSPRDGEAAGCSTSWRAPPNAARRAGAAAGRPADQRSEHAAGDHNGPRRALQAGWRVFRRCPAGKRGVRDLRRRALRVGASARRRRARGSRGGRARQGEGR